MINCRGDSTRVTTASSAAPSGRWIGQRDHRSPPRRPPLWRRLSRPSSATRRTTSGLLGRTRDTTSTW